LDEIAKDVVYDPASSEDSETKGWSYFALGHWYHPKAKNNGGVCTTRAADDWLGDENDEPETAGVKADAWNSRLQPTCALKQDFPQVGGCSGTCQMQGVSWADVGESSSYTGIFLAYPGRKAVADTATTTLTVTDGTYVQEHDGAPVTLAFCKKTCYDDSSCKGFDYLENDKTDMSKVGNKCRLLNVPIDLNVDTTAEHHYAVT
jgi:hypothetical protein